MLIDEIIPYEKNARHNEKAIPVVADSIREFGLRENRAFVYTPNKRGDVSISVIMELGVTRKEEVVTAWAIEAGSKNPHLVTAYPRKRKG